MGTSGRPVAAPALPLSAVLALSACAADSDAGAATTTEAETVGFTWVRNVAAVDEDPQLEETTAEVPKNLERIVVFDMASLGTIGAA